MSANSFLKTNDCEVNNLKNIIVYLTTTISVNTYDYLLVKFLVKHSSRKCENARITTKTTTLKQFLRFVYITDIDNKIETFFKCFIL